MKVEKILIVLLLLVAMAAAAQAGVDYLTPDGGWFYITEFDTDFAAMAAEGWYEDNEEWDGSAPGEAGTAPGGAVFLTEGDTTYLRIQDPGRPSDHSEYSDPSNRKVKFWFDLEDAGLTALEGDTLLDDGVTFSFRARIATTGILDDFWSTDGSTVTPWPATGDGHQIHNSGNAMFGIHQALPVNPSDDDGNLVGFSLVTVPDLQRSFDNEGLTMNSLNGTSPTGGVDSNEGTRNLTPAFDVTEWHEFWITIEKDGVVGTHIVTIYMDGGTDPFATFNVTGGWNDTAGNNGAFINIGSTNSDEAAAWDTDFMAVKLGVHAPSVDPTRNPAPGVSAGNDQLVYAGDAVQLNGVLSDALIPAIWFS